MENKIIAALVKQQQLSDLQSPPVEQLSLMNEGSVFYLTRKRSGIDINLEKFQLRNLKNKFSTVPMHLTVAGDKVNMVFGFHSELKDIIKEAIKNRAWDPNLKTWYCPLERLPDVIKLFDFLGINVPNHIKQKSLEISANSADNVKITKNCFVDEVIVTLDYDIDIVESIKKLHPKERTYVKELHAWYIIMSAVPELIEILSEFCNIPSELMEIVHKIEQREKDLNSVIPTKTEVTESKINDQTPIVILDELEVKPKNSTFKLEPTFKSEPTFTYKIESSNFSPSFDSYSKKRKSSLLEEDISEDFFKRKRISANSYNRVSYPIAIKEEPCTCGKPEKKKLGVHRCRFYGFFECKNCHNKWTSGYTWKGETQKCRRCEIDNMPCAVQQLIESSGGNCNGPHDTERCGMCRKLGFDCSR